MTDSKANPDSVDQEDPEWFASIMVTIETFIFLLILPVYILDLCSKKRNSSRNAKHTKRLMLAVFLSNGFHQMTWLMFVTTCKYCTAEILLMAHSRAVVRGINQLFLIHRAKLVQGMRPILSKKCFTTILPTIVMVWTIGCLTFGTVYNISHVRDWRCGSYVDSESLNWCRDPGGFQFSKEEKIYLYVSLPWDLVMTFFLLALFIVPMYRVYNTDLGIMNENQLKQRIKLQRLLMWSVILTLINQISSTFWWASGFGQYPLLLFVSFIGKFDPPINVWTSWLMITPNREYLQSVCCCCCCLKADERTHVVRRLRTSLAFTDIDISRRNSMDAPSVTGTSDSTTDLPVSLFRN